MINGFKANWTAVVIRCCQLTKNIFNQNVTRVENVLHMRSYDYLYHWKGCSFVTDACSLLQTLCYSLRGVPNYVVENA